MNARALLGSVAVIVGVAFGVSACASQPGVPSTLDGGTGTAAPVSTTTPRCETFSGGARPAGLSDAEWQDQSAAALFRAAAASGVSLAGVSWIDGSDDITLEVLGDPNDSDLHGSVVDEIVPEALEWAPQVTICVGLEFTNIDAVAPSG